jgi:hypothetical protein
MSVTFDRPAHRLGDRGRAGTLKGEVLGGHERDRRRARNRRMGTLGRHKVVIRPPSMTKSAPVTFPVRSLASTSTTSATSWGVVNLPVTD